MGKMFEQFGDRPSLQHTNGVKGKEQLRPGDDLQPALPDKPESNLPPRKFRKLAVPVFLVGFLSGFGTVIGREMIKRDHETNEARQAMEKLFEFPPIGRFLAKEGKLIESTRERITPAEKAEAEKILKAFETWVHSPYATQIFTMLTIALSLEEMQRIVDLAELQKAFGIKEEIPETPKIVE